MIKLKKLNTAQKTKARKLIQRMKVKMGATQEDPAIYDKHYYDFLDSLREESLPLGITGDIMMIERM